MKKEEGSDRHSFDSWEVIKIVLDSNPSLKQRVFVKLRELKAEMIREGRLPEPKPVDEEEKKK